jgi:hypothetical protein
MTTERRPPQGYLFEILEVPRCFEACFLQAVSELLPPRVAKAASHAYVRGDKESSILQVIFDEGRVARNNLIAGAYDGNAYAYFFAAVERAAARALSLFGHDNVLPFLPRSRESA